MLRWGDPEDHHYVIGVFSSLRLALKAGVENHMHRGGVGKYQPRITQTTLDGDKLNTVVHSIDQAVSILDEMEVVQKPDGK